MALIDVFLEHERDFCFSLDRKERLFAFQFKLISPPRLRPGALSVLMSESWKCRDKNEKKNSSRRSILSTHV